MADLGNMPNLIYLVILIMLIFSWVTIFKVIDFCFYLFKKNKSLLKFKLEDLEYSFIFSMCIINVLLYIGEFDSFLNQSHGTPAIDLSQFLFAFLVIQKLFFKK